MDELKSAKKELEQELKEYLRPYLVQFHKRSARRKLCRIIKDSPLKDIKIMNRWKTGELAATVISAQGIKVWVQHPDGGHDYMEYNANGDQIGSELRDKERGLL